MVVTVTGSFSIVAVAGPFDLGVLAGSVGNTGYYGLVVDNVVATEGS